MRSNLLRGANVVVTGAMVGRVLNAILAPVLAGKRAPWRS